jgi:tetratricopeptide (TPR) repeat protein
MKNRMFMIAAVLSTMFYWPTCWSIENPGVGNPIGPGTVPPSSFQSDLVNNPSPIDTNGNLLITGNVRRGRHFRGDVPYRSPTSFGSSLGSSALSSFLRDTAGPEDFQTYSNKYGTQPYYSPTETVTTMMPGRSEIFLPESTRASTRVQQDTRSEAAGIFGLDSTPQEQTLFSQDTATADSDMQGPVIQYSPLAQSGLTPEGKFSSSMPLAFRDTRRQTPAQIDMSRQDRTPSAELFKEQVQDVMDKTQSAGWPGLTSTAVPAPVLPKDGREKNESFKLPGQETNIESLRPNFEIQTQPQNWDGDGKQIPFAHQGISALGQSAPPMSSVSQKNLLLQKGTNWSATSSEYQTEREQTSTGALEGTKGPFSSLTGTGQDWEQNDVLERIRRQLEDLTKSLDAAMQRRDSYKDESAKPAAKQQEKPLEYQRYVTDSDSQRRSSMLDELKELSQAEVSAEANRIKGPFNNLESLSASKFNQHMRDAEEHLKAGRYYRAAGCFSLASVYQPDNPLALAGRGHALFAAGEYVSSALFLSRALAIGPEYLQMRVDLAAILGDSGKLAGRIADIEQWLARSGSSQLQFLLGYVYYRTGQLAQAKQAIDAAYEKTPESPAVQAMKISIDYMIMKR